MRVRFVGLVMCRVSMIGVHGVAGECMLIGVSVRLNRGWFVGVCLGMGGLAAVG